jgi:hypothetical protein
MGKGANAALLQNSGNAQNRSSQLYGDSQAIGGPLTQQLQQESTNPQGYTPQQLAYMNTASQQSLGGGTAATTGTANLEAARSKNVGGFQGAVGSANRGTQRQASQNALGIQTQQANLQEAQKQQALQSLQSLYGTDVSGSSNYLNSSNTALNAENQAPNFWQSLLKQGMQTGGQIASADIKST